MTGFEADALCTTIEEALRAVMTQCSTGPPASVGLTGVNVTLPTSGMMRRRRGCTARARWQGCMMNIP